MTPCSSILIRGEGFFILLHRIGCREGATRIDPEASRRRAGETEDVNGGTDQNDGGIDQPEAADGGKE